MDFISGQPSSKGYYTICTCIDKFTKFVRLISCLKGEGVLSTPEHANLFFSTIVQLFGVPKTVLYDHDSWFTSKLWKALWIVIRNQSTFYKCQLSIDGRIG